MKRSLKVFSLLLMLMIMLTGCFKKDAKSSFENAVKRMDDIKGVTAKIDANIEMSAEGESLTMGVGLNGDFSNEDSNPSGHYTVTMNLFGMNQETEMYTTTKEGYTYNYTKEEDGWVYTKTEFEGLEEFDVDEFLSYVKDVKENDGVYTVTLDKNKLNELAKKEEVKDVVEESGFNEIKEDLEITAKIDKGYVTYLEIDIAKLVKAITGENNIEGTTVGGKVTVSLSNINKVNKISIPEEVTKNAKEQASELDTMGEI